MALEKLDKEMSDILTRKKQLKQLINYLNNFKFELIN